MSIFNRLEVVDKGRILKNVSQIAEKLSHLQVIRPFSSSKNAIKPLGKKNFEKCNIEDMEDSNLFSPKIDWKSFSENRSECYQNALVVPEIN